MSEGKILIKIRNSRGKLCAFVRSKTQGDLSLQRRFQWSCAIRAPRGLCVFDFHSPWCCAFSLHHHSVVMRYRGACGPVGFTGSSLWWTAAKELLKRALCEENCISTSHSRWESPKKPPGRSLSCSLPPSPALSMLNTFFPYGNIWNICNWEALMSLSPPFSASKNNSSSKLSRNQSPCHLLR